MEFQIQQAACGEVGLPLNDDVLICREILRDIKTSRHIVKIPFAKDIVWRDLRNRRNLPIFLDIIKSYAVLRHRQRTRGQEGALIADVQDFYDAKALYTSRAENQGLKLTDQEMKLCIILAGWGEATKEEIAKAMKVTKGRVRHLVSPKWGTSGSLDSDEQGTTGGTVEGTSQSIQSTVSGTKNATAIKRQVFEWATMWERMCNTSLNSSNIVAAAMEYCEKHKISQMDDVLAIFRKYAKIPPPNDTDSSGNIRMGVI